MHTPSQSVFSPPMSGSLFKNPMLDISMTTIEVHVFAHTNKNQVVRIGQFTDA